MEKEHIFLAVLPTLHWMRTYHHTETTPRPVLQDRISIVQDTVYFKTSSTVLHMRLKVICCHHMSITFNMFVF